MPSIGLDHLDLAGQDGEQRPLAALVHGELAGARDEGRRRSSPDARAPSAASDANNGTARIVIDRQHDLPPPRNSPLLGRSFARLAVRAQTGSGRLRSRPRPGASAVDRLRARLQFAEIVGRDRLPLKEPVAHMILSPRLREWIVPSRLFIPACSHRRARSG